ncbi:SCO family protein [Glaciimonas sp. PCH181]|uniref:SCO family protein n=1 Tax=Glaciimonas sp. PCH181 TaxID=2133943 RepID=UPI00191C0DB5
MKRFVSVLNPLLTSVMMAVMAFSLAACGDKAAGTSQEMTLSPQNSKFINTDVTGLGYARDFALTDNNGKPRTLADFKGKAVVVFFGYTQCPDVCPTTMAEMGSVMKELGPLADKVQVLFITVDPERDTQALLAQYVPAFDPRFLGLYGDLAATEKVAKEFRVFYQKVPGKTPGSYSIDHTAGSYVFDPAGHIRLFVRHGQGPDPIVHDLKLLLS